MLNELVIQIGELRNLLEHQLSENVPYERLCETSKKLDVLIVEYHKIKMMHNDSRNCTSRND